jgi:alpha-tubulin suppressor-like RCC1 family protein
MGMTPAKIPSFTSVKAIASRGYHTLALKTDGTVWAWGNNGRGVGDGTRGVDKTMPVRVLFPDFFTHWLFLPLIKR